MEPFLSVLHRLLPGLPVRDILELVVAYMDDVDTVGKRLENIITVDSVTKRFEAISGQILNRNRKLAILGLGDMHGPANSTGPCPGCMLLPPSRWGHPSTHSRGWADY